MRAGGHNGMIRHDDAFHNFVNAPNKTDTKERVRNAAPVFSFILRPTFKASSCYLLFKIHRLESLGVLCTSFLLRTIKIWLFRNLPWKPMSSILVLLRNFISSLFQLFKLFHTKVFWNCATSRLLLLAQNSNVLMFSCFHSSFTALKVS